MHHVRQVLQIHEVRFYLKPISTYFSDSRFEEHFEETHIMQFLQMRKNLSHEGAITTLTPPTTPEQTGDSAKNRNDNLNSNNATENAEPAEEGELKIDESAVSETTARNGRNVCSKNEHKPIRVSVIKRRQIN